ncbi:hypothetical protein U1Q18_014456, partial [Sarracenia purpurea var. burkii]
RGGQGEGSQTLNPTRAIPHHLLHCASPATAHHHANHRRHPWRLAQTVVHGLLLVGSSTGAPNLYSGHRANPLLPSPIMAPASM